MSDVTKTKDNLMDQSGSLVDRDTFKGDISQEATGKDDFYEGDNKHLTDVTGKTVTTYQTDSNKGLETIGGQVSGRDTYYPADDLSNIGEGETTSTDSSGKQENYYTKAQADAKGGFFIKQGEDKYVTAVQGQPGTSSFPIYAHFNDGKNHTAVLNTTLVDEPNKVKTIALLYESKGNSPDPNTGKGTISMITFEFDLSKTNLSKWVINTQVVGGPWNLSVDKHTLIIPNIPAQLDRSLGQGICVIPIKAYRQDLVNGVASGDKEWLPISSSVPPHPEFLWFSLKMGFNSSLDFVDKVPVGAGTGGLYNYIQLDASDNMSKDPRDFNITFNIGTLVNWTLTLQFTQLGWTS